MADPIARGALAVYRGAGRLITPALAVLMAKRTAAGKEDPTRRPERFGLPDLARPEGGLVWIHAASVGETISVLPLVAALTARGPRVLLTTGTVTSARVAASRLPARTIHQYAPLDVSTFVGRFLDHWRPDLAIFVESEIWPATMSELASRSIPQVLVNARMSERSARRWAQVGSIARDLFGRLALVLAQSAADADRIRGLGAGPVLVTGNMKFDGASPRPSPYDAEQVAKLVEGRTVWLAASTHQGEEAIVAAAHRSLAARFPGLLTVLVPRHPERGAGIRAEIEAMGLAVAQRSQREPVTEETGILLVDTIGELALFYGAVPLAFVGGSLVECGGHNPIEPAELGAAVLHGPNVRNFDEIYRAFGAAGAARLVPDAAALEAAVAALLDEPEQARAIAAAGRRLVAENRGALARSLAALEPYLARVGGTG